MLAVNKINAYNLYPNYNISFQSNKTRFIPELTNFVDESVSAYRNFYKRPTSIVDMPLMSRDALVMQDILPIGSPHLLLLYKDKLIYSLAEKYETLTFKKDFNNIFVLLKNLYPNQNIIFFEHGSGNAKINGLNSLVNAGKSVKIAHGHFCVMPEGKESSFDPLLSHTQQILEENNWQNLHKTTVQSNNMLPRLSEIFEGLGYKKPEGYPPYLLISEFVPNTKKSKAALIVQQNPNAKTPSQLFRKLISEDVLGENNKMFWDWKCFLSDIFSQNPSSYAKFRADNVQNTSVDFVNKLDRLQYLRTDDSVMLLKKPFHN